MTHRKVAWAKRPWRSNLAVAAKLAGYATLIVDLDPQIPLALLAPPLGSDSREAKAPVVVSAQAARLAEVLATGREHGAALCFIDTAPHAESPALAAARAADLVLIPCRASILDLRAVTASYTIAQLAGTPASATRPAEGLPVVAEQLDLLFEAPSAAPVCYKPSAAGELCLYQAHGQPCTGRFGIAA